MGKVLIFMDNASIHKCPEVRDEIIKYDIGAYFTMFHIKVHLIRLKKCSNQLNEKRFLMIYHRIRDVEVPIN